MDRLSVRKDKKNATYDGIGSAMTISIRVGPSKSVGVTQSGEDCSRSLFSGQSHGDNRKTHQLKKRQNKHFFIYNSNSNLSVCLLSQCIVMG